MTSLLTRLNCLKISHSVQKASVRIHSAFSIESLKWSWEGGRGLGIRCTVTVVS